MRAETVTKVNPYSPRKWGGLALIGCGLMLSAATACSSDDEESPAEPMESEMAGDMAGAGGESGAAGSGQAGGEAGSGDDPAGGAGGTAGQGDVAGDGGTAGTGGAPSDDEGPGFGAQADIDRALDLWETIKDDYQSWALFPGTDGAVESGAPHGAKAKIYVSPDTDVDALKDGDIILKDNLTEDDELEAITLMVKVDGYDPDNQDWFWAKYNTDGTLDENPDGIALAGAVAKKANADASVVAAAPAAATTSLPNPPPRTLPQPRPPSAAPQTSRERRICGRPLRTTTNPGTSFLAPMASSKVVPSRRKSKNLRVTRNGYPGHQKRRCLAQRQSERRR